MDTVWLREAFSPLSISYAVISTLAMSQYFGVLAGPHSIWSHGLFWLWTVTGDFSVVVELTVPHCLLVSLINKDSCFYIICQITVLIPPSKCLTSKDLTFVSIIHPTIHLSRHPLPHPPVIVIYSHLSCKHPSISSSNDSLNLSLLLPHLPIH